MIFEDALALRRIPGRAEASERHYALGITRSLSDRCWVLRACDAEAARGLELKGLSAPLAHVLAARGVTRETVDEFLNPRLKTSLPDPFVLAQMERAVDRFVGAIENDEAIAVFGDYDVDGACASALIVNALRALGRTPILYIPDRMTEGYGPNANAMRNLRERGATLCVTVDCGAAAGDTLEAARGYGLDVIVLDHHAVERDPPAYAHVNPNRPGDASGLTYICAAGLAFLFLVGVQRSLRQRGRLVDDLEEIRLLDQLDIVALATVADVVTLTGVNRAFVRQGLKKLDRLERPGFAALAELAGVTPPFSAHHLGFIFGPRINAGGRVGRCDLGAHLLTATEEAESGAIAAELERHNRERQAIEAQILEQVDALAAEARDEPFLLVTGESWHAGVIGIVAGRLKERHSKPVLVAGFDAPRADAIARGSARSVAGIDLGAIIRAAREAGHLEAGGGHAMAAGFALRRDRVTAFAEFLRASIEPQREQVAAARDLELDALVSASGATLGLIAELDRAGPYGAGNPEPVFVLPDMQVAYAGIVGSNHVRLRLVGRDAAGINAIAFRAADTALGRALLKARGARIHAAGKLKRDEYGGTAKAQLHLADAALTST
jgi:single-stranded-DNA-specific exonuclease